METAQSIFLKDFLTIIAFFHLYHCFYEAGGENMCENIAKAEIFDDKIICKEYASSPTFMECLTQFLTT